VEEARNTVRRTLEHSSLEEVNDHGVIKEKIRADLKRYINRNTQRRPLIIPVIMEI
jgi:ribonuclease J